MKLFVAVLFLSNLAFAAKFQTVPELTSKRLEALATLAKRLQKQESVFGDCSRTGRYSFTRKDTETDVNTLEQLNVAKAGIFHDEDPKPAPVGKRTAKAIVDELIGDVGQDEEFEKALASGRKELITAFTKVLQSTYLEVYETNHANEDGSWKIVDVLDPRNGEILLVRFGYCGT